MTTSLKDRCKCLTAQHGHASDGQVLLVVAMLLDHGAHVADQRDRVAQQLRDGLAGRRQLVKVHHYGLQGNGWDLRSTLMGKYS